MKVVFYSRKKIYVPVAVMGFESTLVGQQQCSAALLCLSGSVGQQGPAAVLRVVFAVGQQQCSAVSCVSVGQQQCSAVSQWASSSAQSGLRCGPAAAVLCCCGLCGPAALCSVVFAATLLLQYCWLLGYRNINILLY